MKKIYFTIIIFLLSDFVRSQAMPGYDCNQSTVTAQYTYSIAGTYTLPGTNNINEVVFLSCQNTIVYDTLSGMSKHGIVNNGCHLVTDRAGTPAVPLFFIKSTGTLTIRPNIQQTFHVFYESGATIMNQSTYPPIMNSCTNISIPNYSCASIGFNEFKTESQTVLICPNPTNSKLSLTLNSNTIKAIALTNLIGQKITDVPLAAKEIDLSSFDKGIYFLRIQTESSEKLYKIIKN